MADNFKGKQVGRQALAVGQQATVLIWNDPDGTPPSQWTLVVDDPGGASSVLWTMGHEQVSFDNSAGVLLAAGQNIIEHQIYGSMITVRIQAATAQTFRVMLVRHN